MLSLAGIVWGKVWHAAWLFFYAYHTQTHTGKTRIYVDLCKNCPVYLKKHSVRMTLWSEIKKLQRQVFTITKSSPSHIDIMKSKERKTQIQRSQKLTVFHVFVHWPSLNCTYDEMADVIIRANFGCIKLRGFRYTGFKISHRNTWLVITLTTVL